MTDLSPAAQNVLDAYWANPGGLVMALRTAVHQLNKRRWEPGVHWARMELLAIADELEGQ
jgi:hypothetical protein